MDSGLILDPWLETYMLMQLSTQQVPDLIERIGRLSSVGQTSVASGQFSLQSRLQMRDLRGRIDDSRTRCKRLPACCCPSFPSSCSRGPTSTLQ